MNLTDEELMLLEQLAYLEEIVFDAAGVKQRDLDSFDTVEELVNHFDDEALAKLDGAGVLYYPNDPDNPDDDTANQFLQGYEWAALLREIKSNEKLMSLSIYQTNLYQDNNEDISYQDGVTPRDPKTRIDTMVFCRTDENGDCILDDAIIAFDGTLGSLEWKDNFYLFVSGDTKVNQKLIDFLDSLPFETYTTIGHSKGANKAAYLYYLSEKVVYCVAMDCPGFNWDFYQREDVRAGIEKALANKSLKQYAVDADFINILLYSLVGAEYYYCQGFGQAGFAENHSPITFFGCFFKFENGEAIFSRNLDGSLLTFTKQTETMKKLHGFTVFVDDYMSPDTKQKVSDYLGNAVVIAFLNPGMQCEIGDEKYTKDDLLSYLMTDKDTLTTIVAYLMVYSNRNDLGWDDIKCFLPPINWKKLGDSLILRIGGDMLLSEAKKCFEKGEFSGRFWWLWHKASGKILEQYPDLTQEELDSLWIMALDKSEPIEKYVNSFYPHTTITAPSDPVRSIVPESSEEELNKMMSEPKYEEGESTAVDEVNLEEEDAYDIGKVTPPLGNVGLPGTRYSAGLLSGAFSKMDKDTLYLNNAVFNMKKDNVLNASNNLVFNTAAFEHENEVVGTECMFLLTDYWHQVAKTTDNYKTFKTGPVNTTVEGIVKSINDTDNEASKQIEVNAEPY